MKCEEKGQMYESQWQMSRFKLHLFQYTVRQRTNKNQDVGWLARLGSCIKIGNKGPKVFNSDHWPVLVIMTNTTFLSFIKLWLRDNQWYSFTYLDIIGSYSNAYHLSWISFRVNRQENFTPKCTAVKSFVCDQISTNQWINCWK